MINTNVQFSLNSACSLQGKYLFNISFEMGFNYMKQKTLQTNKVRSVSVQSGQTKDVSLKQKCVRVNCWVGSAATLQMEKKDFAGLSLKSFW